MTVLKFVATLLDHISVTVTVATLSPLMGEPVWMLTNVTMDNIAAHSYVQILLEGSCVVAIQASSSTLTKEHAQVWLNSMYCSLVKGGPLWTVCPLP